MLFKRRGKRRAVFAGLSVFFIAAGALLLAYPFISEYIYENRADSIVAVNEKKAGSKSAQEKAGILKEAVSYNKELAARLVVITDPFTGTVDDGPDPYYDILNMDGKGYMCAVEIPSIDVHLPVRHGTDKETLENGVGHIKGSSLPIGGESTHCVLSGHTGLNHARMFSDLSEVMEGDIFYLKVLGYVMAYKVCEINVVTPEDISLLTIRKGRDLCTLVTCTPYGVNSHRLLVTGERVPYSSKLNTHAAEGDRRAFSSVWLYEYKMALLAGCAAAFFFRILLAVYIRSRRMAFK